MSSHVGIPVLSGHGTIRDMILHPCAYTSTEKRNVTRNQMAANHMTVIPPESHRVIVGSPPEHQHPKRLSYLTNHTGMHAV